MAQHYGQLQTSPTSRAEGVSHPEVTAPNHPEERAPWRQTAIATDDAPGWWTTTTQGVNHDVESRQIL
ncbi:hypothetical protein PSAC2689_10078 [Paraburkholderia sacchari]